MIPTKVFNMKSNKGRNVPNQFLITTNEGFYFQSYQTTIAFRDNKNQVYANLILKDKIGVKGEFVDNPVTELPTEEVVNAKLKEMQDEYDDANKPYN